MLIVIIRMHYAGRGAHLDLFLKVAAKGEVYPPKKEVAPAEGERQDAGLSAA